ncbi:MAG: glycosyltransferase family 4 protein [Candidatus Pacebacteria bacterium]|nr:glycosyltransferase family 4 protein [Candidatus Paceibacterota bacterium]
MKKNILIISDSYPPEIRSAAQLMKDLADGLKSRGHNVWVATSYPKYNLVDSETSVWPKIADENGIKVLRIKTLPHHKVNFIIRGIAQLLLPHIFFQEIKKNIKDKIDVTIVHSPPLPLAITAYKVKKFYKAKYVLNLHDIFPQNAIDLGVLKNKLIIKFFERMERNAYQNSDLIVVPSNSHKQFLEEKRNVPAQKIQVIHHWIDINPFLQLQKTGKFRKLYNLKDKFVFLFGGVIGPSQGLDLLIKIADRIKEKKDIVFLLVGDGSAKEDLIKTVQKLNLKNVIFKPFVSLEEYPELVKDCDVGLVCLTDKNTTPAVPAKILSYLTAAIPVIAFLHKESDGCAIVQDAKCGYAIMAGNLDKAVEIVEKIYNEKDKLKEMGDNGFKYALNNFAIDVCLDKIEEIF